MQSQLRYLGSRSEAKRENAPAATDDRPPIHVAFGAQADRMWRLKSRDFSVEADLEEDSGAMLEARHLVTGIQVKPRDRVTPSLFHNRLICGEI